MQACIAPKSSLSTAGRREEQVFEREAVLGRDASSVFPTESAATAGADAAATKASLGALRFITESEVPACGLCLTIAHSPRKTGNQVAREVLETVACH